MSHSPVIYLWALPALLSDLGFCITVNANFNSKWPHSTEGEGFYWAQVPLPALLSHVHRITLNPISSSCSWMSNCHGWCRTCLDQGSLRSLKGRNFQAAPGKRWYLSQHHFGKPPSTDTRHTTTFTGEKAGIHRLPDGSAIGWLSLAFNGSKSS